MGKLKTILLGTFLFAASVPTFAGWRIVIDRNCIATVGANLASQKLIEGQHNQRLDSIASKKQKVELYTVSMATIKELYKLSMETSPVSVRRVFTTRKSEVAPSISSKTCRNLLKRWAGRSLRTSCFASMNSATS